jgi:CheY-like chemotaxis protein
VVDDDVVVHMTLTIALPDTKVIEATRRRPGFDSIRAAQPDAIVIDRRMPDGDGLALVRMVREDPATDDIPIVVLTAGYDEADRPEVMEAGADAYLAKPFEPDELLAVVEGLIESRPPRAPRAVPERHEQTPDSTTTTSERRPRRAPLRAASRQSTGLPVPGSGPAPASSGLPAATKVAVDAVALGAALARAEAQAEEAMTELATLQAALEDVRDDNRRLLAIVDSLEAQLVDARETLSMAAPAVDTSSDEELEALQEQLVAARHEADEADQLRRELSRAYHEIEILDAQVKAAGQPAEGQRILRKRPIAPSRTTAAKKRTTAK